ncbi:MAG: hypothetical protein V4773_03505 [Verrucomicrobiota bacterium]
MAGFAWFLWAHTAATAGGADSSGYLNSARLLAEGRLQTELRLPPEISQLAAGERNAFTPLGFQPAFEPAFISPTYPTGLPLHFALASRLFGWGVAAPLVVVVCAVAAVWLCFLVGREAGISTALAAAGAVILGAFPVFLFSSIQALSDTPATAWCLATLYFALRARRASGWAWACGLAFSVAVLVRPTNLVFAPAPLILLGFNFPRLLRFALAGLPAAAWLAFYNTHQYGGPFLSGYGDIASHFVASYGWPTLIHFAKWLAALLPSVVLVLPFFALVRSAPHRRAALALAMGFATLAGLYLFYDISHEVWWCLRFILPVVPALILCALLGVETLARGFGRRWPSAFRPAFACALGVWAVASSLAWTPSLGVFMIQRYEQAYEDAALAAKAALPPDALVACFAFSGSLYFYTPMSIVRSDIVEPHDFTRYSGTARAAGRAVCAVVFDFEEEELRRRCPGKWKRVGGVANVGFWKLE